MKAAAPGDAFDKQGFPVVLNASKTRWSSPVTSSALAQMGRGVLLVANHRAWLAAEGRCHKL